MSVIPADRDGPRFEIETVYTSGAPGATGSGESEMVTLRSASGFSVSVSVAALLVETGSMTPDGGVTLAVLASVPVAAGLTSPSSTNVADPPARRFTEALIGPEPDAGQEEPGVAVHVQDTPVIVAGGTSLTVAPVTAAGPALETAIV